MWIIINQTWRAKPRSWPWWETARCSLQTVLWTIRPVGSGTSLPSPSGQLYTFVHSENITSSLYSSVSRQQMQQLVKQQWFWCWREQQTVQSNHCVFSEKKVTVTIATEQHVFLHLIQPWATSLKGSLMRWGSFVCLMSWANTQKAREKQSLLKMKPSTALSHTKFLFLGSNQVV